MNYQKICKCTISDGPGVRCSLYVSGCRNHCPGCHNPEAQDFESGKLFTNETQQELFAALNHEYIFGFTLCGGEPMEPENQRELVDLVKKIRETFPTKSIWCYTGYTLHSLLYGDQHIEVTDELLSYIDVLVDGPFKIDLRDVSDNNRWRGSTNQRVLDLQQSLKIQEPVFLKGIPNNTK